MRGPAEGEDAWAITHGLLRKARRQIVMAFDTLTTPKMPYPLGETEMTAVAYSITACTPVPVMLARVSAIAPVCPHFAVVALR